MPLPPSSVGESCLGRFFDVEGGLSILYNRFSKILMAEYGVGMVARQGCSTQQGTQRSRDRDHCFSVDQSGCIEP